MSTPVDWINAVLELREEIKSLHTQLQAKEDHITALETENLKLRTVMGVMAKHIPVAVTTTRTEEFL